MSDTLDASAIMKRVQDIAKRRAIQLADDILKQLEYEFSVAMSITGTNRKTIEAGSIRYQLEDKGDGQYSFHFDLSQLSDEVAEDVKFYWQNARRKALYKG